MRIRKMDKARTVATTTTDNKATLNRMKGYRNRMDLMLKRIRK
mgnify:CR=1 FL=1